MEDVTGDSHNLKTPGGETYPFRASCGDRRIGTSNDECSYSKYGGTHVIRAKSRHQRRTPDPRGSAFRRIPDQVPDLGTFHSRLVTHHRLTIWGTDDEIHCGTSRPMLERPIKSNRRLNGTAGSASSTRSPTHMVVPNRYSWGYQLRHPIDVARSF